MASGIDGREQRTGAALEARQGKTPDVLGRRRHGSWCTMIVGPGSTARRTAAVVKVDGEMSWSGHIGSTEEAVVVTGLDADGDG